MKLTSPVLATLCMLASLGNAGQETRTAADDLSPRWSVGQRWDYEVLKTREQRTPQGPAGTFSSTSTISIDVLEATERGFVLRYVVRSIDLAAPAVSGTDELAQEIARLVIDVPFEIEVTSETSVTGIRNLDDLRPTLEAAVERLYEAAAEAVVPGQKEVLDRLFDQVRTSYMRDETVLASGLSDLALFLLPFGWSLEPGTPLEQDIVLPNPLGGPPVPAPSMDDVCDIGRRDEGTFVIDASSWTLDRVQLVQQLQNAGASRVDRTEFRLTDAVH